MDELKPCPFCGGKVKMARRGGLKRLFYDPFYDPMEKRPTCTKCGATMFAWIDEATTIRF